MAQNDPREPDIERSDIPPPVQKPIDLTGVNFFFLVLAVAVGPVMWTNNLAPQWATIIIWVGTWIVPLIQ